jgi:hypothetical protein
MTELEQWGIELLTCWWKRKIEGGVAIHSSCRSSLFRFPAHQRLQQLLFVPI